MHSFQPCTIADPLKLKLYIAFHHNNQFLQKKKNNTNIEELKIYVTISLSYKLPHGTQAEQTFEPDLRSPSWNGL